MISNNNSSAYLKDDFYQEAVLALYRAVNTFDLDQNKITFGLYAKICIRNSLISLVRKVNREKRYSNVSLSDIEADTDTDTGYELTEVLSEKLYSVLTAYEYEVFMRFLDGKKPRMIAKDLGKSAKSVSNAIFRARNKVKILFD